MKVIYLLAPVLFFLLYSACEETSATDRSRPPKGDAGVSRQVSAPSDVPVPETANDGDSPFTWEQIKPVFEADRRHNKRDLLFTKRRWQTLMRKYQRDIVGTLRKKPYATPELIHAVSIVPRPFFAYQYENDVDMMDGGVVWNRIIDIGWGSTMSATSIQGLMTAHLEPAEDDVALEIGTGSGIQAAILSRMVKKVYTVEIREALAKRVRRSAKMIGYDNIEYKIGDGYYGWKEKAPFDIIIVTCQANHVPPALIQQLAPGGRMVAPVGQRWSRKQQMLKFWKDKKTGRIRTQRLMASTLFIPMVRSAKFKKEQGKTKGEFDFEHKEFQHQKR